jgi:hypothetical protein
MAPCLEPISTKLRTIHFGEHIASQVVWRQLRRSPAYSSVHPHSGLVNVWEHACSTATSSGHSAVEGLIWIPGLNLVLQSASLVRFVIVWMWAGRKTVVTMEVNHNSNTMIVMSIMWQLQCTMKLLLKNNESWNDNRSNHRARAT